MAELTATPSFAEKLETFKKTQRWPHALLVLTNTSQINLDEILQHYTHESVSEAKGNLLIVGKSEEEITIKVDEIRELLGKLSLSKWDKESKRFVFIPHAEKLTSSSSNALLKTLEEPGPGTHFILFAPSRRALLKTILSRCTVLNGYELSASISETEEKSRVFFQAFFQGDTSSLAEFNRADFKLAFEDFKAQLKEEFINRTYSGELHRSYWFELFDFIEKTDLQLNTHTDVKWLIRSIEEFILEK